MVVVVAAADAGRAASSAAGLPLLRIGEIVDAEAGQRVILER
jgi:hypothetical protein